MYVKFQDSQALIECTVVPNGNIVTMKFPGSVVVDTSGFNLYLDAEGEYDIGGNDYLGFTTIYRNGEETEKYNGYQLSNDGSVWVKQSEPEPQPELEPYVPTPEEIAEQERQSKIAELNSQILALKERLASTDYIFIKSYEASLVGEFILQYDLENLHSERQGMRDEINALEEELNSILNKEGN